MAITSAQQEVLKIVVGLFNAVPGKSNFDGLSALVDEGMTSLQIAEALDDIPLFVNDIVGSASTIPAKVAILMNNFGLSTAGDLNPNSAASQANAYFTLRLGEGAQFGTIVNEAVQYLSAATVPAEFANTVTLLNNKATVSEYYSVTKGLQASTLAELQQILSKVTATSDVSTPEKIDALIAQATDSVAPEATAATFDYVENATDATVLGTVAATDNVGVTGFEIVSGNDSSFFAIDASGKITLTAAGVASAANDFEADPNSVTLGVVALDVAGNRSAAVDVILNETDVDDVAPAIDIDNPASISGSTITMNFNEALKSGSIPAGTSFTVLQGSTAIGVNSVTVSGSSVTLGLSSAPTDAVTVSYVAPSTNPLQDAQGNKVADISALNADIDTAAPTLVSSTPADNIVDVAVADNIVLTFSEPIKAGTGDIKIVSSTGADDRTISITDPQVAISGNTVTINPTTDLSPGLDYSIQMAVGVLKDNSDLDFAGLIGATALNFTTVQPVTERLTSSSDIKSGNVFDGSLDILSGQSVETLTAGDRLTATGSNTALNAAIQEYAHSVLPLKLTGIETVNVSATTLLPTGAAAGAPTLNLANADTSTKNFSISGQVQNFTLTNIPNVISAMGITAAGNGADFTGTFASTALAGASDSTTLTLNQLTGGATPAANATDVTLQPSSAGSGFETLNIISSGGVPNNLRSLTDGNGTSLGTVNFSGSQNLWITNALDDTVTTVNASGTSPMTGNLVVTVGAASGNVATTGGSGDDTLTYAGTYNTSDVINGGADTAAFTTDGLVAQKDTLSLTNATAIVTAKQTNVSNIETIQVSNALNGALNLTHFGAVNAKLTGGLGAASTITYTSGTGGLVIDTTDTGANTLGITMSGSATTDTLNVDIKNADMGAAFTTTGVETVNLRSMIGEDGTVADGGANTATAITLTDTAATETLNISGDQAFTLTGAVTANVINAGSMSGAFTMAASTVATGGAQITGGSGNDTLCGSGVNDIITGGAGNDRIIGSGNQGALVANQADLLTGGAGVDTFVFYDTLAGAATVSNATNVTLTQITDFVAGTDKIALITGGPATSVNLNTAQTISTAANAGAIITGMTALTTGSVVAGALQAAVVTVSGGAAAGTYLYVNDTTAGLSATNDMLINITGVSGTITSSDFVFA
ncbi:MAG: Ig-like domain-containing protein [Nitrosomonas sp.]|nr:Ig-like domain-containing protein [Nitrosomonas sp.]